MYKLCPESPLYGKSQSVIRLIDGACIPYARDNTDYQTFKKDLADGVELKDAEGNAMTADQIASFLGTLP